MAFFGGNKHAVAFTFSAKQVIIDERYSMAYDWDDKTQCVRKLWIIENGQVSFRHYLGGVEQPAESESAEMEQFNDIVKFNLDNDELAEAFKKWNYKHDAIGYVTAFKDSIEGNLQNESTFGALSQIKALVQSIGSYLFGAKDQVQPGHLQKEDFIRHTFIQIKQTLLSKNLSLASKAPLVTSSTSPTVFDIVADEPTLVLWPETKDDLQSPAPEVAIPVQPTTGDKPGFLETSEIGSSYNKNIPSSENKEEAPILRESIKPPLNASNYIKFMKFIRHPAVACIVGLLLIAGIATVVVGSLGFAGIGVAAAVTGASLACTLSGGASTLIGGSALALSLFGGRSKQPRTADLEVDLGLANL